MSKRFFVEPRASQKYPWQFVDIRANERAYPVSIHATKREAEKARDEYRRQLKRDAAAEDRWIAARARQTKEEK